MGTRADFYVGNGVDAEWLGSIAWDGYRDGIPEDILVAKTEESFRKSVSTEILSRKDGTTPEMGWPWPWNNSATSDCSYWFFEGKVWDAVGCPKEYFFPCDEPFPDMDRDHEETFYKGRELVMFPDMTDKKKVTLGQRSGLLILGG